MAVKDYQRIAIIGLPGSGKSSFSLNLSKLLNLPLYHLDNYVFEGNKKRNKEEYLKLKEKIVNEPSWIIEGCSLSTLEMRFSKADAVIYFKLPRLLCLWRLFKRIFTFNSKDKESGCYRSINWTLLKYMWNFNKKNTENIVYLIKKYPYVDFYCFQHSKEADLFLKEL